MRYFFTSDTHFGHANIIKYCNRPFDNVEEMNEGLIEKWNAKVSSGDTVFHLGDVAFGNEEIAASLVKQLNGEIHLIRGNHDYRYVGKKSKNKGLLKSAFASVSKSKKFYVREIGVILEMNHVPYDEPFTKEGIWHLHGHTHGKKPCVKGVFRMDVGVDCHSNWEPFSLEEIIEKMEELGTA